MAITYRALFKPLIHIYHKETVIEWTITAPKHTVEVRICFCPPACQLASVSCSFSLSRMLLYGAGAGCSEDRAPKNDIDQRTGD